VNIGDRIRTARKAVGLSQEEVARRAGLSLKGMGEIERGDIEDPHISSLMKIAGALSVPVEDLLEEPELVGPKADAPQESGQSETSTRTVEEFEQALARVLEPARTEALREWQASNRLESSQRKTLVRIVDPPEAAVAKRFVEEFSPEEWPLAFAVVAVGHARHEQDAEALSNNMAALRKESLAELKKKDQRIADLEAEIAQLKEGDVRMRQENARLRQDLAEYRAEAEQEGAHRQA